jgi:4-hydroxysphinganine ceramide fatty acyl 2-hydroxylase
VGSASYYYSQQLQITTRTVWYVVPLFWFPIASYLFIRSLVQFSGPLPPFATAPLLPLSLLHLITTTAIMKTLICFFLGNFIWTILEYLLHRFLFHIDEILPDHPAFLTLHFLLHGIHHYLPMDR